MCTTARFRLPISTASEDCAEALAEQVRDAAARRTPLSIVGGGTKAFLGRRTHGEPLDVSRHRGLIAYEPSELVISARAGTRLGEIEGLIAGHGQMLAFEPPRFGEASTIGGTLAAGLSGARRPFAGAVRDCVLGVTILDGQGRRLRFGGTVFKNVAGFDVFRLMAGAMGRLGVLLDVSLRLAPAPKAVRTLAFDEPWPAAQSRLNRLMMTPLPLTGAAHRDGRLFLRLEGGEAGVAEASSELGGEGLASSTWDELREFKGEVLGAPRLWRLSLPRRAVLDLPGRWLINWAGAERWLVSDAPTETIRAAARDAGGHASLFRGARDGEAVFEPLDDELMALHRRLAGALDPAGILNPGRIYEDL